MKRGLAILCIFVFTINVTVNTFAVETENVDITMKSEGDLLEKDNEEVLDILNIKKDTIEVLLGSMEDIKYIYESALGHESDLIWTSENEDIARIVNGKIETKQIGKTKIKVENKEKEISDECIISVVRNFELATKMDLDNGSETKYPLEIGATYELSNTTSNDIVLNHYEVENSKYNIVSYNSDGSLDYMRISDSGYINIDPEKK